MRSVVDFLFFFTTNDFEAWQWLLASGGDGPLWWGGITTHPMRGGECDFYEKQEYEIKGNVFYDGDIGKIK